MAMKKNMSLRMAFWKFLIWLLIGISGSVMVPFGTLMLGEAFGVATYANYSEQSVRSLTPLIASASDLSKIQLPAGTGYVRLDREYRIIEASLEGKDLERALEYAISGQKNGNSSKQYLLIERETEYVILQYYIGSRFTNEWLNRYLPTPETILYLWIACNCIMVCVCLTTKFAKRLGRELRPLFQAAAEVSEQNLDFEIGHSGIKEFEDMLLAFGDMRDHLKISLEKQWRTEQSQREQIAALAHDLKTPLTIIQGNAELLGETQLSGEQRGYVDYIGESSEQMQQYIRILIDISRASMGYQPQMEKVACGEYLRWLGQKITVLCNTNTKEIQLQMAAEQLPDTVEIDRLLLERAVMNIVNNALDYAPEKSTLHISAKEEDGYLRIAVTDEGKGFSREALLHAREQFFMDDQSRSSRLHYGMGLYIADSIAGLHGGSIELRNSEVTHGAEVILKAAIMSSCER